ncbi:hypothetical protein [Agrobacterium cavarae]|uniref:hypothetical protein n=1 Tax=Agrobacterium cavarae TaxID=2528239 RepID=UPI0028AEF16D|nr:hypothetical protein [Agrobacterium cavarae]
MQFSQEIENALAAFARNSGVTRDEAIARILRERMIAEGDLASGQEGIPPEKLNATNDD